MDTGMYGIKVHTGYASASTNTNSELCEPHMYMRFILCQGAICGRRTTAHTHGHVRKCHVEQHRTTSYTQLTQ